MTLNRVIVQRGKEKRIVQRSMIPEGFRYVKDYKEPEKNFSKLPKSKLKDKLKKDLQAHLDNENIEYGEEATKADLIALIVGE